MLWNIAERLTPPDFTSLISETEVLLAQREIQKPNITDQVWTDLRHRAGKWLWVNNDQMSYEVWDQGRDPDHQCPNWNHSCGALKTDCGRTRTARKNSTSSAAECESEISEKSDRSKKCMVPFLF
ncbi:hypothetical protein LDENG_00069720 [Lucifuga dentata]|nr:hypothetical protein LDENG_00069720 [Lucifuga dentata]